MNRHGLRAALTEQVRTARHGLGFDPTLRFDGPLDLVVNDELAADVQVVAREALANIMRHANASAAWVQVSVADGCLVARIADDGVGLPEVFTGSGTVNLAVRAQRRAGTFSLQPRAGGGTVLTWSARLSPDQKAAA